MTVRLGLVLICACFAGGCDGERAPSADRSPGREPASRLPASAPAIVLPDLAGAADSVREQIRARYEATTRTAADQASRAAAYGELGKVLMAASYPDAAERSFLNARALAPGEARWMYYLGQVYRQRSELDKAIDAFEQVFALQPDDVATLVWLGEMNLALGRPENAEPLLRKALGLQPRSAAVVSALGRVRLARRDYRAAVQLFEQALALEPQASALHYPLSLAYRGAGDETNADAHLRERGTVEASLEDPLMRELSGLLESASVYDTMGRTALERGDWAAAAESSRRGIALAGDNQSLRASLHHRLGTALAQMGDGGGALQQFREAVRVDPAFVRGYFSLGAMMMSAGRTGEAIAMFKIALAREPDYVEARIALADTLRQARRTEEALAEYRRALDTRPRAAAALFGEALALAGLGRYAEARDRLVQAMSLYPGDPAFPLALARVLAAAPDDRVRDGSRALAIAQPIFQAMPSIEGAEAVAMALAELGKYDDAAGLQTEAVAQAQRAGLRERLGSMNANLRLYQASRPARAPWRDEPFYEVTR